MTSKESNRGLVGELGATPVVADALDPDQVAEAVGRANPEVIVHQLTAIGSVDMRHFDRDFALTNRLRTEGTDYLPSAGRAVGVRRFVAQSAVYGFYARSGGAVKSEEDPIDPSPPRWLPALAQELGAKKPMRVPRFVGRMFAGETGAVFMTEIRGASNAKARRDLGWQPKHASWREGSQQHDRSRATA